LLDQLDEIPWQRLHHAYGTAEDVPELLRALARPDQKESALNELFHIIWHQGSVYEASSYAVPFLFELACEQSIARREDLLGLVGSLADGTGPVAHVHRTRDQVYNYSNATLQFLNDRTPMVRAAAAFVLSRFPEQVSILGPNIIAAARRETNALAKAALLWCIGKIRDHSSEAWSLLSVALRESADPRQAFAAAVAMFSIKGELQPEALSLYRQMAAATWFAQSYLGRRFQILWVRSCAWAVFLGNWVDWLQKTQVAKPNYSWP
jgi:hypothetical protein